MKKLNICMYGGASKNVAQNYYDAVTELGREIADRGHKLIYGGGASGMMGAVAKAVVDNGGLVTGVVPNFLRTLEPVYENCTILIKTETMSDRKQIMEENADAFVIAPGGIGTFDEFFQILTLKDLGRTDKPIVLFNVDGYYDSMTNVIVECTEKGFIRPHVVELYDVCPTAVSVLDTIERHHN
ncbi:MAG: TIGR00730 family Rossman fold protein [Clostridiales bacterium]|nr:TIGR00730 family Rossman fold protein [Clostridiales bacterium]